jgi:hypothetical protein
MSNKKCSHYFSCNGNDIDLLIGKLFLNDNSNDVKNKFK